MRRIAPTALTLCSLLACQHGSPEDQVREAFATTVAAVERGDASAVADMLAPDFQGPEGMDRGAARLYLMGVFRQGKVGATVLANRLQIDRGSALQAVDVVLTSKCGGLVPEEMGRRSFVIRWRKSGSNWRIRTLESAGPNP